MLKYSQKIIAALILSAVSIEPIGAMDENAMDIENAIGTYKEELPRISFFYNLKDMHQKMESFLLCLKGKKILAGHTPLQNKILDLLVDNYKADQITNFILSFLRKKDGTEGKNILTKKIFRFLEAKSPIHLVTIGFPFKCINHIDKCISEEVDLAEYLGLFTLHHIVSEIKKVSGGCLITIISDGLPYHIKETDEKRENIVKYHEKIETIIKGHFSDTIHFISFKIGQVNKIDDLIECVKNEPASIDYYKKSKPVNHDGNNSDSSDKIPAKILSMQKFITKSYKFKNLNKEARNLAKKHLEYYDKFCQFVSKNFIDYDQCIRIAFGTNYDGVDLKVSISPIFGQQGAPWHNAILLGKNKKLRYLNQKNDKKDTNDKNELPKINHYKICSYKLKNMDLKYLMCVEYPKFEYKPKDKTDSLFLEVIPPSKQNNNSLFFSILQNNYELLTEVMGKEEIDESYKNVREKVFNFICDSMHNTFPTSDEKKLMSIGEHVKSKIIDKQAYSTFLKDKKLKNNQISLIQYLKEEHIEKDCFVDVKFGFVMSLLYNFDLVYLTPNENNLLTIKYEYGSNGNPFCAPKKPRKTVYIYSESESNDYNELKIWDANSE